MNKLTPFPCNSCGKCCRRVNLSEQTRFLDRGDAFASILMKKLISAKSIKRDLLFAELKTIT